MAYEALEGNKSAEKWTEEAAIKFFQDCEDYIEENENDFHLGLICKRVGQYPHLWSYLAEKFESNETVFSSIKNIEVELEARIINSTLSGEIKSAAMAIFYLKNKHGYVDKQVNDHTIKTKLEDLDDEEIESRIKKLQGRNL